MKGINDSRNQCRGRAFLEALTGVQTPRTDTHPWNSLCNGSDCPGLAKPSKAGLESVLSDST